ncbi:MAG: 30S ribosomal protein S12 methylthiotransferase RimO [Kiritimatiellia bacterium]
MSVSIGFISLGCAKNLVDSQIMAGYLKERGFRLAESPETADVILINTCAFIDIAREEAAETILSACAHKNDGNCKAIVVTGCMVQRYRERMAEAFPDVDGFLGIDELDQVGVLVDAVLGSDTPLMLFEKGAAFKLFNPPYPTLLFTGGPFANLRISEGCDHRCAYCSIPDIRGPFRSRNVIDICEEAFCLVQAGVKELNIISQDTFNYGADDKTNLPRLEELISRIDSIEGDYWIRLLYGYPSGVTSELLEMLNDTNHILRYLDLPIQHSHPDILRLMNRSHAVEATQDMAQRLRSVVPGLVLRTTCLVGFPGETDKHFEHLAEYVRRSKFDHLGVFAFSPEEGTPAYDMEDIPEIEIAEERCSILMQIQEEVVRNRLQDELCGKTDKALLLNKSEDSRWRGRLTRQAAEVDGETCISNVPSGFETGDFINVRITGGRDYDLEADLVFMPEHNTPF